MHSFVVECVKTLGSILCENKITFFRNAHRSLEAIIFACYTKEKMLLLNIIVCFSAQKVIKKRICLGFNESSLHEAQQGSLREWSA